MRLGELGSEAGRAWESLGVRLGELGSEAGRAWE